MTWRLCLRPCVAGAQDGDSPRAVGLLDHLWALAARCFVRRPCREPLPLLRLSTRSLRNVYSAYHVPALCRLCAHWEHLTAPVHVKSSAADPSGGASHVGVWVGGAAAPFWVSWSLFSVPLCGIHLAHPVCLEQSSRLSHGCCALCVSVSHVSSRIKATPFCLPPSSLQSTRHRGALGKQMLKRWGKEAACVVLLVFWGSVLSSNTPPHAPPPPERGDWLPAVLF